MSTKVTYSLGYKAVVEEGGSVLRIVSSHPVSWERVHGTILSLGESVRNTLKTIKQDNESVSIADFYKNY